MLMIGIINELQQQVARSGLGTSSVMEVLSNILFPSSSTVHTLIACPNRPHVASMCRIFTDDLTLDCWILQTWSGEERIYILMALLSCAYLLHKIGNCRYYNSEFPMGSEKKEIQETWGGQS
jgi:hypothetical protein